jgi:hypothetical protein
MRIKCAMIMPRVVIVVIMLIMLIVVVVLFMVIVIVMLIVVVVIIVIIKGYWDNALCRHNHRAAEGRGFGKTF